MPSKSSIVHRHETLKFPKGFLWGAATSAHQAEGWNEHNDWWRFEARVGAIAGNDRSHRSADHYSRYERDFDLLASLHLNAHRLSLEWSRLAPHENAWDMHEVEHYQNVLSALRGRGITTMVTLWHFTLPAWLAAQGGWENSASVEYFARYTEFAVKHFHPYVDFWITINEPLIYIILAYLRGIWPPAKKSWWRAARVYWNLARAHRRAYKIIRAHRRHAPVGVASNIMSFVSYRKHSLADTFYVRMSDWLWNHSFIVLTGRRSHDFIGVNYYIHHRVKHEGRGFFHSFVDAYRDEARETSDIGWEIYPQGLSDVLLDLAESFPGKPIYITENGVATINDDKRARFIVSYIKELKHAIQAGADVRGYFYWSLLDSFEWEKGFAPRFGLIQVDYRTLKRTVRPSANIYGHIAKENGIPHELLRFVGHGVAPKDVEHIMMNTHG